MSLLDVPADLFVDLVFHLLSILDVLSLTAVNRWPYALGKEDASWFRRLVTDFPCFDATKELHSSTTRPRILYQHVFSSKLYIWSGPSPSTSSDFESSIQDASTMVDLTMPMVAMLSYARDSRPHGHTTFYGGSMGIPGARCVGMNSGGSLCYVLDFAGDIHVLGESLPLQYDLCLLSLAYCIGVMRDVYRDRTTAPQDLQINSPSRLLLPIKFRSFSCSSHYAVALDVKSKLWVLPSCRAPFRISSPLLNASSPETTPVQVDCGDFASVLTRSVDILVFRPSENPMKELIASSGGLVIGVLKSELSGNNRPRSVISCHSNAMQVAALARIPLLDLKSLPVLPGTGLFDTDLAKETKLVKIAVASATIIGLTNKGHVLRFKIGGINESHVFGNWEYLPQFCDLERVRREPTFLSWGGRKSSLEPPPSLLITHISAHMQTFFAYTTGKKSVVLMGKLSPPPRPHNPEPIPIPRVLSELHNRGAIETIAGTYHCGALLSTGEFLTWINLPTGSTSEL